MAGPVPPLAHRDAQSVSLSGNGLLRKARLRHKPLSAPEISTGRPQDLDDSGGAFSPWSEPPGGLESDRPGFQSALVTSPPRDWLRHLAALSRTCRAAITIPARCEGWDVCVLARPRAAVRPWACTLFFYGCYNRLPQT